MEKILSYWDLHWIELLFRFVSTVLAALLGFGSALFLFNQRLKHDRRKEERLQKNTEAYKILTDFRDMVDDIPDLMASFVLDIKKEVEKYKEDSRYIFLNGWVSTFHKMLDEKATILVFRDRFLKPLNKSIVDNFQLEFFAQPILTKARKSNVKQLLNT